MIKIESKKGDLGGGMIVKRILPSKNKRMVGPFCFFDHMGPIDIQPNQNTDVRPHPHIGLSTLTYLFEGRMVHRDSLGYTVEIEPGEVNWMTAGSAISHSERAHDEDRSKQRRLHGLQFWIALPDGDEEIDPSFQHYDKDEIPTEENEDRRLFLVAGQAFGMQSPVMTSSPLLLADIYGKKDFNFRYPTADSELALYVVNGSAKVGEDELSESQMMVFEQNTFIDVEIKAGTHFILLGGQAFNTPRFIWWNLVSSSREKIEEAKAKWKAGTFPMVPGETEFIPLPE